MLEHVLVLMFSSYAEQAMNSMLIQMIHSDNCFMPETWVETSATRHTLIIMCQKYIPFPLAL